MDIWMGGDMSVKYLNSISPSLSLSSPRAPKAKTAVAKQENITLGPNAREGELVFGVCRIFASFNDTFVVRDGQTDGQTLRDARLYGFIGYYTININCLYIPSLYSQHVTDLTGRETLVRVTGKVSNRSC